MKINKRRKKKRQFWVPHICLQKDNFGIFNNFYYDLSLGENIITHIFKYVQENLVISWLWFKRKFWRKALNFKRVSLLALRFLASRESQQSVSFSFRIGRQSVSRIVAEKCKAIDLLFKGIYLKSPQALD